MDKKNRKKMNLQQYFEELSQAHIIFRDRVIEACGCSMPTFYRWMRGEKTPSKLEREQLALIIGRPVDELFPGINGDKN